MKTLRCIIVGKELIGTQYSYKIIEKNTEEVHFLPSRFLDHIDLEFNQEYSFTKRYNRNTNEYQIEFDYEVIELEVVGQDTLINHHGDEKSVVLVKYEDQLVKVEAFPWQNINTWSFDKLRCSCQRVSLDGVPFLKNRENRHNYFRLNDVYDFEVIDRKKKNLSNGETDFFVLKGIDEEKYELKMQPGQVQNFAETKTLKCKVTEIGYLIRLWQTDLEDPFFKDVEDLFPDQKVVKEYFYSIVKSDSITDMDQQKLLEQYQSKSAFWVFTFTNRILPIRMRQLISQYDFEQASIINEQIQTLEKWILKSGIITCLKTSEEKKIASSKAEMQIEKSKRSQVILRLLIENKFDFISKFLELVGTTDFDLWLFLSYSNQNLVDDKEIYDVIIHSVNSNIINPDSRFSELIAKQINWQKNEFLNELEVESFNLTTRTFTDEERLKNIKYLNWSFFEFLINGALNNIEQQNILGGQILRGLSLLEDSFVIRKGYLFNAYNFLENHKIPNTNPFIFTSGVEVDPDKIIKPDTFGIGAGEQWIGIEDSFNNHSALTVTLTSKSKSGYDLRYKNVKGFLPIHMTGSTALNRYGLENCHLSTNVICRFYNKTLNYIIVEQLREGDKDYLLKNHSSNSIKIGEVLTGRIKAIQNYGLFIATESGEGLLHISEIFDFDWDQTEIYENFEVGQRIRVYVKSVEGNRISFSTGILKRIEPKYYQSLVNVTFSNSNEKSLLDSQSNSYQNMIWVIQKEKAFCFEQLALFQNDINDKINCISIAKQFYVETKHARSYLIDIYVLYFKILLDIRECADKRDLDLLTSIKANSKETETKINSKTLETFPETNKLRIFLKIIQFFNEDNDDVNHELYDMISQNSNSYHTIRTLSKITLSNNLMISESSDNETFIIRNLNLIYQFLSSGIFSLKDQESDRFFEEKKKKAEYLRKIISSDESETVEFKASLFKPYPDEKRRFEYEKALKKNQNKESKQKLKQSFFGVKAQKIVLHSAFKNLCAFANSGGGKLLIGVNDDKTIRGIEGEYNDLLGSKKDLDGYGLFFDSQLMSYFEESFSSNLKREVVDFDEGSVLVITVLPSSNEIFILKDESGNACEELYIRNLSSAKALSGRQLANFLKDRHSRIHEIGVE